MDIEIKPNIVSEQDVVEILNDGTIEQMLAEDIILNYGFCKNNVSETVSDNGVKSFFTLKYLLLMIIRL